MLFATAPLALSSPPPQPKALQQTLDPPKPLSHVAKAFAQSIDPPAQLLLHSGDALAQIPAQRGDLPPQ